MTMPTERQLAALAPALVVVACVLVLFLGVHFAIKNAGGVKQIIIDVGRDVKEIAREINKD